MGANIAEIQMYDHDAECVFSMLTRIELEPARFEELRQAMNDVAKRTRLSIRTWSPTITGRRPRLAICVTYRPEPALALLRAIRDGHVKADVRLMVGNREKCRGLAEQFGVPGLTSR
jgi:formyltetrahydrofolate deformylase